MFSYGHALDTTDNNNVKMLNNCVNNNFRGSVKHVKHVNWIVKFAPRNGTIRPKRKNIRRPNSKSKPLKCTHN